MSNYSISATLVQIPEDPAQLRRTGTACAAVYKGHGGSVLDLAAAPGGDKFASASQDKTLRIWPTGQEPEDDGLPHHKSHDQLEHDFCR